VGAPEATRERVALRCLQEVGRPVVAAGGDAAATARVLRVDGGARSCEDVLFRLIREVRGSSYAGMRTLTIHIRLPILSGSAEVLLSACVCFCSCLEAFHLEAFHPGNGVSG
jgi:hypothetical protein